VVWGVVTVVFVVLRLSGDPISLLLPPEATPEEIERLRDRSAAGPPRVPDADRASTASLNQRNELLLAENRRLRNQVAELTAELAIAYGQRRAQDFTTLSPRAPDATSEGRL